MKYMKALVLIGLITSALSANPLCVNDGSYAFYESNYNTLANACQIGDKLFWGFAHTDNSGNGPLNTQIQVQPLPFDGLTNIGISFNSGGWIADPGFPIDFLLSYHVVTLSGAPIIDDATLSITGTLSGGAGAASATITETLNPAEPGTPLVATLPSPVSSHVDFPASMQSTFLVTDHIQLSATTGSSHVSVIENDFSESVQIPEPVATGLIGSGLLLFGLVRRRQRKV